MEITVFEKGADNIKDEVLLSEHMIQSITEEKSHFSYISFPNIYSAHYIYRRTWKEDIKHCLK